MSDPAVSEALAEPTCEGRAPFHDWETWYRVTGDLEATAAVGKAPLVVLHGVRARPALQRSSSSDPPACRGT